jgi:hypothetical protein
MKSEGEGWSVLAITTSPAMPPLAQTCAASRVDPFSKIRSSPSFMARRRFGLYFERRLPRMKKTRRGMLHESPPRPKTTVPRRNAPHAPEGFRNPMRAAARPIAPAATRPMTKLNITNAERNKSGRQLTGKNRGSR